MPEPPESREQLLRRIQSLARRAIFGTPREHYRTCKNPDCPCHDGAHEHGPFLYVTWCSETGKTQGCYIPKAAADDVHSGIAAWHELQQCLRELAELNKQHVLNSAKKR